MLTFLPFFLLLPFSLYCHQRVSNFGRPGRGSSNCKHHLKYDLRYLILNTGSPINSTKLDSQAWWCAPVSTSVGCLKQEGHRIPGQPELHGKTLNQTTINNDKNNTPRGVKLASKSPSCLHRKLALKWGASSQSNQSSVWSTQTSCLFRCLILSMTAQWNSSFFCYAHLQRNGKGFSSLSHHVSIEEDGLTRALENCKILMWALSVNSVPINTAIITHLCHADLLNTCTHF